MVLEIVSVVAIVASAGFVGWQVHELSRQTRYASQSTGSVALRDAMRHLDDILRLFVVHPELRPYFYGGQVVTDETPEEEKQRVETIAELLCDSVSSSLKDSYGLDPFHVHRESWEDYGRFLLSSSPATRDLLTLRPTWWPEMADLMGEIASPSGRHDT